MNALSNIYAEGDTPYADKHLAPLDPIIVEGEGYLYGIRSIQIGKTFSKVLPVVRLCCNAPGC